VDYRRKLISLSFFLFRTYAPLTKFKDSSPDEYSIPLFSGGLGGSMRKPYSISQLPTVSSRLLVTTLTLKYNRLPRRGCSEISTSQPNKTYIKLIKTSAVTLGVASGILSVTHPQLKLESGLVAAQPQLQRPNTVVIMVDDLSRGELNVALNKG